jgi:hypothetical protein
MIASTMATEFIENMFEEVIAPEPRSILPGILTYQPLHALA